MLFICQFDIKNIVIILFFFGMYETDAIHAVIMQYWNTNPLSITTYHVFI